ncbi:MAG: carboxymuconolactone decarboxylase family protein [Gammaproteobacteria bacterium]
MARNEALFEAWARTTAYFLHETRLPLRDRELLILRTAWLCRAAHPWGQHVRIAHDAGLDEATIERVTQGPDAPGWAPFDCHLLRSVDELRAGGRIADPTWQGLAQRYDHAQLLEVPALVGHYHLNAWLNNSLDVGIEPGAAGLDAR